MALELINRILNIKYGIDSTERNTGSVINNANTNVLVGETASQAFPDFQVSGINTYVSKHYNSSSFGSCPVYYFAERKADVYTGNYGLRYWTKKVEGGVTKYIIFANGYQASDYFRVLGL